MRWLDGIIDSMDKSLSRLRGLIKDSDASCATHNPWGYKELDMT